MSDRRRKKWQKYLSMALAVTLTFSSASTGWAQEAVPAATESTEAVPAATESTEAVPAATESTEAALAATESTEAAPVEPVKDTKAQATETEAPETKAVETAAPETTAPETQVPETLPSDTEAAATEAQTASGTEETTSESQTAGTEATESESAATEAESATESESAATEAESATESESAATEAESATELGTEAVTETESEKDTEPETTAVSETATEAETETETETPKTWFTYEDKRVKITAVAQEEGKLPQEAQLRADYIAPGTEAYNEAVAVIESQLLAQLGAADENTQVEYTIYDVYFLLPDGSRIEPEAGNVKVEMTFKQLQAVEAEGEIVNKDVIHIQENGQAEIVTDYVNTNENGEVTSMGFTQDSFSPVIAASTFSVASQGNAASGRNGVRFSANLNEFITGEINVKGGGLTIDPVTGKMVMDKGATYSFTLKFAETNQLQFYNTKELVYVLPDGLDPIIFNNAEKFTISIGMPGYTVDFNDNTYRIRRNEATGKYEIVVKFDSDHNQFMTVFAPSPDIAFELGFEAKVTLDKNNTQIAFSDTVKKEVTIRNEHSVDVQKIGAYNKEKETFDYTITVTSTGYNKNIVLTDELKGSALGLVQGSIKEWKDEKEAVAYRGEVKSSDAAGFSYQIPEMNNGETVVLKYSAAVDYDKLNGAASFSEATTKNTVTWIADDMTMQGMAETFSTEKAYETAPVKEGSVDSSSETLINWTITVNQDRKAGAAGKTVTDELTNIKELPARFSGDGIKVEIFDENGLVTDKDGNQVSGRFPGIVWA